jgi:hypothetical protein
MHSFVTIVQWNNEMRLIAELSTFNCKKYMIISCMKWGDPLQYFYN